MCKAGCVDWFFHTSLADWFAGLATHCCIGSKPLFSLGQSHYPARPLLLEFHHHAPPQCSYTFSFWEAWPNCAKFLTVNFAFCLGLAFLKVSRLSLVPLSRLPLILPSPWPFSRPAVSRHYLAFSLLQTWRPHLRNIWAKRLHGMLRGDEKTMVLIAFHFPSSPFVLAPEHLVTSCHQTPAQASFASQWFAVVPLLPPLCSCACANNKLISPHLVMKAHTHTYIYIYIYICI